MERTGVQISLNAMLGLIALVAINFWLFRIGAGWGFLGLYMTKHVVIAYLCQVIGINRRPEPAVGPPPSTPIEVVTSPPA